jgi:acyl-coenzyme A thioesterase PaaI-like protein
MSIKSLKQGRTLAFLEMELWDEDKGRLVRLLH